MKGGTCALRMNKGAGLDWSSGRLFTGGACEEGTGTRGPSQGEEVGTALAKVWREKIHVPPPTLTPDSFVRFHSFMLPWVPCKQVALNTCPLE